MIMYIHVMEKIIGIYIITSPSGKVYIGQSKDCLYRWKCYSKLQCKKQRHLYNSLLKYGSDNHVFRIIEQCAVNELDKKEIHWINRYKSTNKAIGLNLREGGNGKFVSEETREIMRKNALGNTNMLGKFHSIKSKKLISNAKKGLKASDETRKRMRNARSGYKHSNETKMKISKAKKFTRKIKNTGTSIIHNSITRGAIDEQISQSTIYRGLKDGRYEYI